MCTVDAHAVHAVLDQVLDERVVVGRLAGHGDHDRDTTIGRNAPEQWLGLLPQELLTCFEIDHSCCVSSGCQVRPTAR